jgi:phenylacetate-CoA ligase
VGDTVKSLEALQAKVAAQLASSALIHADVKLCQPGSLPRSEGKAKRVIDRRKL